MKYPQIGSVVTYVGDAIAAGLIVAVYRADRARAGLRTALLAAGGNGGVRRAAEPDLWGAVRVDNPFRHYFGCVLRVPGDRDFGTPERRPAIVDPHGT